ncbi:MAG: redox-sensing transcriptional repressor Rex [Clostridia bacterium]|nr:redox-sensing transcriptional repressor Rex [Clostridia bacterium]
MTEPTAPALPVVRRLPRYYRFFSELKKNGVKNISSRALSELMGLTASQIRQDFSVFGIKGQQGCGYDVTETAAELGGILRLDRRKKAVLIGAGNLGRAISEHMDFEGKGYELIGIFDSDPALTGTVLRGLNIMSESELAAFCLANKPEIAILCVPTEPAPELARLLYDGGVRAFWNFSHANIAAVCPDAVVENVHLSDSLMILSYLYDKNC